MEEGKKTQLEEDTGVGFTTTTATTTAGSPDFHCILCEECYDTSQKTLEHMALEHHLIIADAEKIADMKRYLAYWHGKIKVSELPNYTSTVDTRVPEGGSYFLLSDILPEDKEFREKLKQEVLCQLLEQQKKERQEKFDRKCLFCSKIYRSRDTLFSHMLDEHHFNIGRADNLVFIHELLDHIQGIMDNITCIYCGRVFKNHAVLKKHMRKKKHFKINSKDTAYDKFYMINYLEPGKKWEDLKSERDDEGEDPDEEWDDWDENVQENTECLFCRSTFPTALAALDHAKMAHSFDFYGIKAEWGLDFYGCIKMINYIRRQVSEQSCPYCETTFNTCEELEEHMKREKHYNIKRDADFWKNPQYLIPAKESDQLLMGFDQDSSDSDDEGENNFMQEVMNEAEVQAMFS